MHASDIGFVALVAALAASGYAVGASILGRRAGVGELVVSGRNAVWVVTAMMLAAAAVLFYSFVTHDFGVEYVARNSSLAQPWYYTTSAFYGGQAGSLLVWATGLAVFSGLAVYVNRRWHQATMPYVVATLMTVQLFFLIILVFLTNPFERLLVPLVDGQGLNPLLRDPGMLIHPPMLLLGYMSWTVPFAFAMGALFSGRLDNQWLKVARPWILTAWAVQSVGLLLGAWWAYHVLGWGGYWGWDPVENVALFPWLAGTALLHSVIAQERRGVLKKWNIILVLMAFWLAIFGTLVVRGGLLTSVHNFATSALGPSFLAFLGFAIAVSLGIFIKRAPSLKSEQRFHSASSKETAFLLNNLLLLGVGFATFWGTIFPLLTEAFDGSRITVGAPFYEKVNGPILLALIVLMGVGPLLAWGRSSWEAAKRNFRLPLAAAIIWTIVMYAALGVDNGWTLAGAGACAFVLGTVALEYHRGVRLRRRNAGEPYAQAFGTLVARNRRRYGGYVVHIGIVLIAIGAIGSNLHQQEREVTMAPGDSAEIGAYTLTYRGIREHSNVDSRTSEASIDVIRGDKLVSVMKPRTEVFLNFDDQPATRIAIRSTPIEDLYVFLAAFDREVATFVIFLNPLVMWLWIGGGVFVFGTLIAVWPEREPELTATGGRREAEATVGC